MEDKTLELITKIYTEMTEQFKEVKEDIKDLKKDVIKFENELTPKVQALFDGYKQHSDQLNRIESEVSKHDEFIIKRVK